MLEDMIIRFSKKLIRLPVLELTGTRVPGCPRLTQSENVRFKPFIYVGAMSLDQVPKLLHLGARMAPNKKY